MKTQIESYFSYTKLNGNWIYNQLSLQSLFDQLMHAQHRCDPFKKPDMKNHENQNNEDSN